MLGFLQKFQNNEAILPEENRNLNWYYPVWPISSLQRIVIKDCSCLIFTLSLWKSIRERNRNAWSTIWALWHKLKDFTKGDKLLAVAAAIVSFGWYEIYERIDCIFTHWPLSPCCELDKLFLLQHFDNLTNFYVMRSYRKLVSRLTICNILSRQKVISNEVSRQYHIFFRDVV